MDIFKLLNMYMCAGYHLHVGQELCHSHARHRAVACAQGHPRQLKGCGQDLQLALVTDVFWTQCTTIPGCSATLGGSG